MIKLLGIGGCHSTNFNDHWCQQFSTQRSSAKLYQAAQRSLEMITGALVLRERLNYKRKQKNSNYRNVIESHETSLEQSYYISCGCIRKFIFLYSLHHAPAMQQDGTSKNFLNHERPACWRETSYWHHHCIQRAIKTTK